MMQKDKYIINIRTVFLIIISLFFVISLSSCKTTSTSTTASLSTYSTEEDETYTISNLEDGTIEIRSYYCLSGKSDITIPSTINGYEVTSIGEEVFANNTQLINVVLPDTIKYIKEEAFEDCSNLTSITLSSNLLTIETDAFSGTGLTSIVLPSSLSGIGEHPFFRSSIKTISISGTSASFYVKDNTLYSQDYETLIFSPNITSITIPSEINSIAAYAFANNTSLTSINLNNVISVADYAFIGCTSLSTISGGNNISGANGYAFLDTPWYKNSGDELILGSVLLQYKGDAVSYTIPSSIEYISENAFDYATNLEDVYINSNVNYIGQYAFANCSNLSSIYILDISPINIQSESFPYGTLAYVPEKALSAYESTNNYSQLDLERYAISASFYVNGSLVEETTIYYGGAIPEVGIRHDGAPLQYWTCNDGKNYYEGNIFDTFTTAVAFTGASTYVSKYTISYNLNGGVNSGNNPATYNLGSDFDLVNPTKFGFVFKNWTDSNGTVISNISPETTGDLSLTANWEGTEYKLTRNDTSSAYSDQYPVIELPSSNFSSPYIITLSSEVTQAYIYSTRSNVTYSLCIIVANRSTPINICLKNVKMVAPSGHNGIFLSSTCNSTINLYVSGSVYITGGNGLNKSKRNGGNGYDGIHCYALYIAGDGSAMFRGGNGANGAYGINGTNGAAGVNGPSDSFLNPIDGDNGTDGYKGGNGGYGVYASNSIVASTSCIFLGGNGGNGGKGGAGGSGGNGASDNNPSIWNGIGDPGNGGDGGNGGNGGNGGDGQLGCNLTGYTSVNGTGGSGGKGGSGGSGGSGGFSGSIGNNGTNGENGTAGTNGTNGRGPEF